MKLPNPQRAVIDMNKLLGYCLNFNYADGWHKARVFKSALGLTIDNAEELRLALLQAIQERDAVVDKNNQYGQKYVVDFPMVRGEKTAIIHSVWIIRYSEDFPRLITCYVL
jgi:hypothetical protein